jgi:hypothetical protein
VTWQTIDTAPIKPFDKEAWFMRHSERVLVLDGYEKIATYGFTKHGKGRWIDDTNRVITPTHWMPLPASPPSGEAGK